MTTHRTPKVGKSGRCHGRSAAYRRPRKHNEEVDDADRGRWHDRAVPRGSGDVPPLLLIMGATGDAGHFATVAEELAETTAEEQADDAAALLRVRARPRRRFRQQQRRDLHAKSADPPPRAGSTAILHEPPMLAALDNRSRYARRSGRSSRRAWRPAARPPRSSASVALPPAMPTGRRSSPASATGCWGTPRPSSASSSRPSTTCLTPRRWPQSRRP